MIHEEVLETILRERGRAPGYVWPDYGRWSLAEVVPTIEAYFGLPVRSTSPLLDVLPRGRKRVVVLLVDGFAYELFIRHARDVPVLRRLVERGDVRAITSVFPSTTPAALTTLHTGLTPEQHGLPEWTLYLRELDLVIETLPFREMMTHGRDTLPKQGGTPTMLYDGATTYERLASAGVRSTVFTYVDYAESTYSRVTQRGAHVVPYASASELFRAMATRLVSGDAPGYWFAYVGQLDALMHEHGPSSPVVTAAVKAFFELMDSELLGTLPAGAAEETVFVLTADHGHTSVEPSRVIYLDQDPGLMELLEKRPSGLKIPPTGGPSDVFLFVDPASVPRARARLVELLAGRGEVMTMSQAIAEGLFGSGRPTPRLLERIGTLLVLPRPGWQIWYRHGGHDFHQRGCHGGLSEAEMLAPFAVARLEALRPA